MPYHLYLALPAKILKPLLQFPSSRRYVQEFISLWYSYLDILLIQNMILNVYISRSTDVLFDTCYLDAIPYWYLKLKHFCHFLHIFVCFWLLIFNRFISAFKLLILSVNILQNHHIITMHDVNISWASLHFFNLKQILMLMHCSKSMMCNRHSKHNHTLPVLKADWQVITCSSLALNIWIANQIYYFKWM